MYAKNLLPGAGHGRVRTALIGSTSHKAKLECASRGSWKQCLVSNRHHSSVSLS